MEVVILLAVGLQTVNFWLISRGRLLFPLILAIYGLYMVIEGWLAYRDPEQSLLWLFVALNAWAIVCTVRGWRAACKTKEEL